MSIGTLTNNQQLLLKETELNYQTLFERTGMGMAVVDADGTFSLVNKKFAQLLKTDVSNLLGHSFLEFVHESDKKMMKEYHTKRLEGHKDIPQSYEFRLSNQDKHSVWVLVSTTFYLESGQTLASVLDISKLKETEKKLKEAISSQNAILNAVPDLMFELDSNGYYLNIWANNPQELAATKKQLLGQKVSEMLPDDAAKQVMLALSEADKNAHSFGQQINIETPDGQLWFELSVSVKHNEGAPNSFIMLSHNITNRKNLETKLLHLSTHDSLTNLNNRRMLEEALSKDIQRANRYQHSLSVCMLDIDNFKDINDTYGHQVGDIVLKKLAGLIEGTLRDTDYTARYGGEEFIVVLPETSLLNTKEFAERLRAKVEKMIIKLEDTTSFNITISIGISTFTEGTTSLDRMINFADSAMYQAKEAGRNCVRVTK